MALTNDQIMAQNFKDFYEAILPYLNGAPTVAADILYSNTNSGLVSTNVQDAIDEAVIQFSTMPTASATYSGKVVQYTGNTTSTYTKGHFYECVENSGSYSWSEVSLGASSLATTSSPGLLRALSGSTSQYLRGDGTWATVSGGSTIKSGTSKSTATQTNLYFIHS